MGMKPPRVFLLGLDGGTWRVQDKLIAAGDTLARLQKARARLELKLGRPATLAELSADLRGRHKSANHLLAVGVTFDHQRVLTAHAF